MIHVGLGCSRRSRCERERAAARITLAGGFAAACVLSGRTAHAQSGADLAAIAQNPVAAVDTLPLVIHSHDDGFARADQTGPPGGKQPNIVTSESRK